MSDPRLIEALERVQEAANLADQRRREVETIGVALAGAVVVLQQAQAELQNHIDTLRDEILH
jgi:predicted NBD/HSP70 family sugar kinase